MLEKQIQQNIREDELSQIIRQDALAHNTVSIADYFVWIRKDPAYHYVSSVVDKSFMFVNKNKVLILECLFWVGLVLSLIIRYGK